MKTVPSLVASSTVGVAAVGLAFGKPERTSPERPSSKKRKVAELADGNTIHQAINIPNSRPATSSTIITPDSRTSRRPTSSSLHAPVIHQQPSPPTRPNLLSMSSGRRLSMIRTADLGASDHTGDETHRRDSVSSRGSWIKRLSTFPSTHSSPRSSIGPDSPSIQVSSNSAAPILSTPNTAPTQLPPNKLVKRDPSARSASDGPVSRTRSRGSVPTLRRPATSHQRSVTLQQQFKEDSARDNILETPTKQPTPLRRFHSTLCSSQPWRQYFEARTTRVSKERSSGYANEGGVQNFQSSTAKRIVQDESARPTLVKPQMITSPKASDLVHSEDSFAFDDTADLADEEGNEQSPERLERLKRPRRSLSLHFSSPSSWVTRTGSLRGKRNDATGGDKRFSSAPGPILPARSTTSHGARNRAVLNPAVFERKTHTSAASHIDIHNDPFEVSFRPRTRNTSQPLPPLSRLSSFNLDLARLGQQSSSSSSAPRHSPSSSLPQNNTTASTSLTSTHVSPSSQNYFTSNSKTPRTSEVADRASTLVGSDNETKGFTSGDEDDMDFRSETVYDSLRSGATNSVRSHHTPLDTMFDESPSSINGQGKNKRQSIHEMLVNGGYQEENARIVEEDEGMPTPVKPSRSTPRAEFETPVRHSTMGNDFPSAPTFSLAARDFTRLSLDDEEDDEDWTRDEENLNVGHLSPPNSMSSRKVSPIIREALADVTQGSTNGKATPAERPKSNIFDWAEPSSAEKVDYLGNSPRPKTAHPKNADSRGGRPLGRKGPTALHIRSQSVPVVPDVAGQRELSKLTSKFSTWGLSAKGVSEDWDNDFDFDTQEDDEVDECDKMEKSGMLVPPAIQASQASVVGHVGQIREVCLLVEDLKRLRLLAKEKNMLDGKYASLWREAEGIIALAVPDEDDPSLATQSPSTVVFEHEVDERYVDQGHDAEELERPDEPVEVLNRHGRPTGFIYDGSTVRRRSVFSPGDDIFGAGTLKSPPSRDNLRIPSAGTRTSSMRSTSDVARSVMETIHQHRSTSDPTLKNLTYEPSNKMPFDTTSLRDLVHRANVLTRTLSDLVNKVDGAFDSPEVTPHRESSPAFTRVFTDPMQSPPKHLPRSQSNNSTLSDTLDSSPTRNLSQRMHMMTVV